jgi:hypothetical protein
MAEENGSEQRVETEVPMDDVGHRVRVNETQERDLGWNHSFGHIGI